MTVAAIIQARMGSTRLPGKVLADLGGEPMLLRVVDRVRRASRIDQVWVACGDRAGDEPLVARCREHGVPVYQGPEQDVLARYLQAATYCGASVVVRITADCPLLDPTVIDLVVDALGPNVDYAANVLERSYPRGLDVEAFTVAALARMDTLATTAMSREHVTLGPRRDQVGLFRTCSIRAQQDDSDLRWTVDTAADLARIRVVYHALGLNSRIVPYQEVVAWCRQSADDGWTDDDALTWDPSRIANTGA